MVRKHWHALLIIPLVVIVMTWPTFPRLFDGEQFWLHSDNTDAWEKVWDAWHMGRVLGGESSLYFSDAMFYPSGISLAISARSTPHAFLLHVLQQAIPTDDAYNLLFLLMLCFNAFCAYLLIHRLLNDKWIALYGALVVGIQPWFTDDFNTAPDLLVIGTLPLTLYFWHRGVARGGQWRFTALAGICAGFTAWIGIYVFLFVLITLAIYTGYLALSRKRQPEFWLKLALLLAVAAAVSLFRFYPMLVDAEMLNERLVRHSGSLRSSDLLDYFVPHTNPFFGGFLERLFNTDPESNHKFGYIGYINIFFITCAIVHRPFRRALAPWLLAMGLFVILRQGDYLVVNSVHHEDILLPGHYLERLLSTTLGQVGWPRFYQIGIVTPLAILSCYGLYALLQSKPAKRRAVVALASITILALEYNIPRQGLSLEGNETAYIDWLRTEYQPPNAIIDLADRRNLSYFLLVQTLHGYPTAFGFPFRSSGYGTDYVDANMILRRWFESESVHCLPYNRRAYLASLDQLLSDGFTHVVVHNWRYGDQFVMPSFHNITPAYDDGLVSVYRLPDLRLNCQNQGGELPQFTHLAQSPWATPGTRASIISFHPSQSLDADRFHYLTSLFSDWDSLLHLYMDNGKLMMQNEGTPYDDIGAFVNNNEIIYLVYNENNGAESSLNALTFLDRFSFCRRDAQDDGSVIEFYLKNEFSCALYSSDDRFQVGYDNGATVENLLVEVGQNFVDIQLLWSNLPSETHSISLQFFDAAGVKAAGQDYVVSRSPVARHQIDISSLPPGDYSVKIIYYNFETGKSVPGTVSSSGERFERALEFATIRKS
ncbi:MAG: glycosyltransferase family 39 protein [Chloroflexi bacterium]|nr:glycosyltransferase family 39 protein [Chloroflexota bacterium]